MAQFRFGAKNSKKFLQYLLTIKSQFHPKRTTLIPPIHPEHPLKKRKLHHFYAVFLGKNPIKKIQKNTYIGFWGHWFRIRGLLTSIISDSKSFEAQTAKNPIKKPEKYIHRFLGSLISNPRSVDLHYIRFKVIWRSECKKPDEKIKKIKHIYISFWER